MNLQVIGQLLSTGLILLLGPGVIVGFAVQNVDL